MDSQSLFSGRSREGNSALQFHIQTGTGAHPTSYLMGTGGSFPTGKAAKA